VSEARRVVDAVPRNRVRRAAGTSAARVDGDEVEDPCRLPTQIRTSCDWVVAQCGVCAGCDASRVIGV